MLILSWLFRFGNYSPLVTLFVLYLGRKKCKVEFVGNFSNGFEILVVNNGVPNTWIL